MVANSYENLFCVWAEERESTLIYFLRIPGEVGSVAYEENIGDIGEEIREWAPNLKSVCNGVPPEKIRMEVYPLIRETQRISPEPEIIRKLSEREMRTVMKYVFSR